jgi:chaperonin GroES
LLVVQTDEDRPAGSTSITSARSKGAPTRAAGKQPVTMLNDRVLVSLPQSEGERRSRAGILIPATAQVHRRLAWAEVAAVGPHVRTVRSGDTVLFNPEECFEVDVQGEEYLILRERDVHAVASERMDGGTGLYL